MLAIFSASTITRFLLVQISERPKPPNLLVAKQHTIDEAPDELSGLQIRQSHNADVLAGRILIVRVSEDDDGQSPPSVYKSEYAKAVGNVRVLPPSEKDELLSRRDLAKLKNTIDTVRAPVLWLMPDDE